MMAAVWGSRGLPSGDNVENASAGGDEGETWTSRFGLSAYVKAWAFGHHRCCDTEAQRFPHSAFPPNTNAVSPRTTITMVRHSRVIYK